MSSKPGLLVTGASGFVGRHVIAAGLDRFDICATGRECRPDWLPAEVSWCQVDLLDRNSVANLPADLPLVLHLASETVPAKFFSYEPLLDSVEMTFNLCRHLRSGRLLFASSCLVYAASSQRLTEDAPLDPRGHYGLAKVLSEAIVSGAKNIEAVIARPFNHIGTGMRTDLAVPSIVRRVRAAADGASIEMSGIDSIRDFLDVRDIVEAYFAILCRSELRHEIFNIASGNATSIGDIVRTVAGILGKPIGQIVFSKGGNSADDASVVVGNAQKLRIATNWMPQRRLVDSLRDLVASVDNSLRLKQP